MVKQSFLSQFVGYDFDINTLHYLLNVAQTNIVTEISLNDWLLGETYGTKRYIKFTCMIKLKSNFDFF